MTVDPLKEFPLMGKYVEVCACMKARKKGGRRDHTVHILKESRVGMVVGYRTIFDGHTEGGSFNTLFEDYDPSYFVPEKSYQVLLVTFWPRMNPVFVLPEDLKEVEFFDTNGLPLSGYHPTTCKWSKESRDVLRKIMKDVPRDSKGRWKK